MPLINLIIIYLKRKHGVPLHNFFEKWTNGTSYLKLVYMSMKKKSFAGLQFELFFSLIFLLFLSGKKKIL